jgi:hypothetical protein
MRHKKLPFIALLILVLGLTSMQAQTMHVKESSGTQTAYTLSNVRKLTFSGGNLNIHETDNNISDYALSGLAHLSFSDFSTSTPEPAIQTGQTVIWAYPNPVSDILYLDLNGMATAGTISILTLDGRLLQEETTKAASNIVTLNLSHLPQGIYLCCYLSAEEIKTIKIIKR